MAPNKVEGLDGRHRECQKCGWQSWKGWPVCLVCGNKRMRIVKSLSESSSP